MLFSPRRHPMRLVESSIGGFHPPPPPFPLSFFSFFFPWVFERAEVIVGNAAALCVVATPPGGKYLGIQGLHTSIESINPSRLPINQSQQLFGALLAHPRVTSPKPTAGISGPFIVRFWGKKIGRDTVVNLTVQEIHESKQRKGEEESINLQPIH